jgi:alkylation response protein AidB-like acyl-CoA dehydrogenase
VLEADAGGEESRFWRPLWLPLDVPQRQGVGPPLRRGRSSAGHDYTRGPMIFDLSADQREIQSLAREFAQAEIGPNAAAWDREHGFPRELFGKLAELGFLGVCVPEEYGGAGADFLSYVLVLEELSRADAGVGVTVAVHTSAVTLPILTFGTDEQRSRFVPPLARGEAIGAFALTEPEAGSDAGSLRTAAVPDGDGWSITGAKQWITNGGFGGTVLLFARTDPDVAGPKGVSAFIVDGDQVRVTREEEKLGLNSSSTVDLALDGAWIGRDRLLHEEGKGFAVAMTTLDGGRIGIAAQALGIAQAAYDVAREYALERRQFGKPIADFQAIQWKLADMATEIDAARLLVYRAAWLKQEGRPHTEEGAKAKLFASETARRQTAEAIQVLGGYGYTKEFPVERYYRDAKITEIYEGTSEIQRLVIARSILGLRERQLAQG